MPATLPVPVSAAVLRWARQESGYSLERAAEKLHFKAERLEKLKGALQARPLYIPDVCRELGVHCITLQGLMRREGWRRRGAGAKVAQKLLQPASAIVRRNRFKPAG